MIGEGVEGFSQVGWRIHDDLLQRDHRRGACFPGRIPRDLELPDHLDDTVPGFGGRGRLARQHGPGGALGIDGVGLADGATRAPVAPIYFHDSMPRSAHRACQPGAIAAGAFDAERLDPPVCLGPRDQGLIATRIGHERLIAEADQRDQANKTILAVELALGERPVAPASPPLIAMGMDTPNDPAIQPGEERADMGLAKVIAPPADDRGDLIDERLRRHRSLSTGQLADLVLEVVDGLLPRKRIPITPAYAGVDLVGAQPQRTLATLDLVPEACKPVPHMDDTRLARMQGDPKRSQDVGSRLQRSHCLRSRPAGDHPIIGVPSQVVAFPTHFPIKWSQKNTAQEWGDAAALRRALFRWETRSLSDAPSLEEARDQLEYTTVGDTLIHQDPELLMVHRPEEISEVGVDDPLAAVLNLPPDLPQRILC